MATLVNPATKPKPARPDKPYVYKPRPVVAPNAIASSSTYRPPIQQVYTAPPPPLIPGNSFGMTGLPLSPTPNGASSFTFDTAPTEASRSELRRARYEELFDRLARRAQCVGARMEHADARRHLNDAELNHILDLRKQVLPGSETQIIRMAPARLTALKGLEEQARRTVVID